MKDHVEIGHLTKNDALRVNRDQVMDLEIRFKIHTSVLGIVEKYSSSVKRQSFFKLHPLKLEQDFVSGLSFVLLRILSFFQP